MTTKRRTAAPGVELVPVDALELHPANPRQGDIGAIVESIQANGWWGVVVAQTSTRRVLVGNHRLQAARLVGMDAVPVHWLDVPDDVALRVLLADNRSNDRAAYDDAALADLLSSILADAGTLDGTLFDGDDLDALLADLAPLPSGEASDDVPPLPVEAKTRVGDVFELGPHRLVCGDSTDPDVWGRLLEGDDEAPTLMVTDPPYGVGVVAGFRGDPKRDGATIANDDRQDWYDVYALSPAPIAYVWHADLQSPIAHDGLARAGYTARRMIIWTKPVVMNRSHYNLAHETCWYAVRGDATANWQAGMDESSVWPADPPRGAEREGHPSPKPVALYDRAIRNHTTPGQVVVDPFGGSGTLVVAADALGRRARLIELDPAYCDVIRQRYADHANRPDLAP